MKLISKFLFLVQLFVLLFFQFGVASCANSHVPVTSAQKETGLTTQTLTSHAWKVFEERGVHGGDIIYYLRGGARNTESFDNEYITFNSNNTGVLTINSGYIYNFTWTFANEDNTKLTWTLLNTPTTYTITWDNIRYKNGNLYHDQYFTDGNTGQNSHTQQIRMPR